MITLHEKMPCDSVEKNYSWVTICKHIVGEVYNDYPFLCFTSLPTLASQDQKPMDSRKQYRSVIETGMVSAIWK